MPEQSAAESEEDALCLEIIHGRAPPDPAGYAEGRAARAADKGFHECPFPQFSAKGLSWRIGWNDLALELLAAARRAP